MRTVEEIFKPIYENKTDSLPDKGWLKWEEVLSDPLWDIIKLMAIEYATEACKEQKRICRSEARIEMKGSFMAGINEQSILNAPLPELK